MDDENAGKIIVEVEKDVLTPLGDMSEHLDTEADDEEEEVIESNVEDVIVEIESVPRRVLRQRPEPKTVPSPVIRSDLLRRRRMTKREKVERLLNKQRQVKQELKSHDDSIEMEVGRNEHVVEGPSFIERITEHPVFDERFYNRVYDLPFEILQQQKPVLPELLCQTTPRLFLDGGTGGDISFLIDTCVPVSDILVDNLGKWTRPGMRTTTRKLFVRGRSICRKGEHDFIVEKRYGIHGNAVPDRSIRKVAWTMRTAQGEQLYSLITYQIRDGATVPLRAHGNAKSPAACVYQRILPSSIEKMKTLRKTLTPKDITMRMVRSAGGLSSVTDSQALPRNDKQLYNLSRYRTSKSLSCSLPKSNNKKIVSSTYDDYQRNTSRGFVQFSEHGSHGQRIFCATQSMVINFMNSCTEKAEKLQERMQYFTPSPTYTDEELNEFYNDEDLLYFSKTGPSMLILDQTYDINDLYLTVFSYYNIQFIRRSSGLHPLCIAAYFLSSHKDEEDYLWAANCLWTLCDSDKDLRVRAVLTDNSSSVNCLKECPLFSGPSVHIRCGVRLQRATKMRLRELGATEVECAHVLGDIYGGQFADSLMDGVNNRCCLVDCASVKQFQSTLSDMASGWPIKGFPELFFDQAEMICEGYLLPMRVAASLGRGYTTAVVNEVKGMNGSLKRYLKQYQHAGFQALIHSLESFTKAQFVRLGEAIFGPLGEFDLAPDFKHLWVDERTWKNLTTSEKKSALFSIGIIDDEMEPEGTIPTQNELPTNLQTIYGLHEWRKLMKTARQMVDANEIKCFDPHCFAVRENHAIYTVQPISIDAYSCTCTDKRPICVHNLAVAIATHCLKQFVTSAGERKRYLTASVDRRGENDDYSFSNARKRHYSDVSREFEIASPDMLRERIVLLEDEHDMDLDDEEDEHVIVEDVEDDLLEWMEEKGDPGFTVEQERVPRRPHREVKPTRRFSPGGTRTSFIEMDNTGHGSKATLGKGIVRRYESDWFAESDAMEEDYQMQRQRFQSQEKASVAGDVVCSSNSASFGNGVEEDQQCGDRNRLNATGKREAAKHEKSSQKIGEQAVDGKQLKAVGKDEDNLGIEYQEPMGDEEEEEIVEEGTVDFGVSYHERDSDSSHVRSLSERITTHPVFDEKFYSRLYDVPVSILQKKRNVSQSVICHEAPPIFLDGLTGGSITFLVDGSVPVAQLLADNLGRWNGPNLRCTTRTFYLKSKLLCSRGEHDFILEKRYLIHANTCPERGIKKVIWTMRNVNGEQLYSLASYRIVDHVFVPGNVYTQQLRPISDGYFAPSSCDTVYGGSSDEL